MAQDEIQRGARAAPTQVAWSPTASITQAPTQKPSTASAIMDFAGGFNRWLAQNNQWAVQDGYMDAINGAVQETTWYNRQGYTNGVNQYNYEQKRLGFVNEAHGLSKLAAVGQITEEEREQRTREAARELSDYATTNLQGEARAQAQQGVLSAYTINAKNHADVMERQAYINTNEANITASAVASDQLVSAQSLETFAQAMPMVMSELRNTVWTGAMNLPDGHKTADKDASAAQAAVVRTFLSTLNPANSDDVAKARLMSTYVLNDERMNPEIRNQLIDHMEKLFNDVRDHNAFRMELENTQVEAALAAGLYEQVPQGYFEQRIAAIKQGVATQTISPSHGTKQIAALEAQQRSYHAAIKAATKEDTKQVYLQGDVEYVAAATGETYDKAATKQADALEVIITQSSGGDSYAAAATMMQVGVDKRNTELVDRGVKRLAGVFGSLFTATPEQLANSDARTTETFQKYNQTVVQAAASNNRGALDSLEKVLPTEYRAAYRQLARTQPHLLSDMRQAIPALNRERDRLDRLAANPLAQSVVITAQNMDSSVFGSKTGQAALGYAANETTRAIMAGNLNSVYRRNILAFDNVFDAPTALDAMYRGGYALQAKNGMFPSNPEFANHFYQLANISTNKQKALEDTVWNMGMRLAQENGAAADNTLFVIDGDRLTITVQRDDVTNTRTFSSNDVAKAYIKDNTVGNVTVNPKRDASMGNYKPTSPYQQPSAPQGTRADMATWAEYQRMAYEQKQQKAQPQAPKKQTSNAAKSAGVSRSLGLAQSANSGVTTKPKQPVSTGAPTRTTQSSRDAGRVEILKGELANEKKAFAQLKMQLGMAKATAPSDKQRASVAQLTRYLEDRQRNIDSLNSELSRM